MPRRCRKTSLAGFSIIVIMFFFTQFWAGNDIPNNKTSYDPEYIKLLRDYQSKRTKKSRQVVIGFAGDQSERKLKQHIDLTVPHIVSASSNFSTLVGSSTITSVDDIFIAVKSSGKFHKTRLPLLLDTWIPLARQSTFLITDEDDHDLSSRFEPDHYKKSTCFQSHYRKDLVCKVSVAYDLFMYEQRRWFCVADDDTYINIPNLVDLLQNYDYTLDWYIGRPSLKRPIRVTIDNINESFWFHTGGAGYCISRGLALKMSPYASGGRLRELADKIKVPDDVAVGYIVNRKLGVDITRVETFHSHLEGLWRISPHDLKNQVTLSYGEFVNGPDLMISNVINTGGVIPTYPPPSDPTRLRSLHCYMFPNARECPGFGVASR